VDNLLLHPKTEKDVQAFIKKPAHAAAFVGDAGLGIGALLNQVAKQLLGVEKAQENRLHTVQTNEPTIGIDDIRKLQHFLSLKSTAGQTINRVVIIENAERMSVEAQNALLKTIEEPPEDSVIVLGVNSIHALLPTIVSRVQAVQVVKPELAMVEKHLSSRFDIKEVERALVMSGGMPALAVELLEQKDEHPLTKAAEIARNFLKTSAFDRLCMIEGLAKQRTEAIAMCDMLARMASVALQKDGMAPKQQQGWQRILKEATGAQQLLVNYAQPKLVLSALCLRV
jgi:DNA polymerase III delta prime subunit